MALSPAELRQRVAAAITAIVDEDDVPVGWHESRFPADLFGLEPELETHRCFAVGIPDTTPVDPRGQSRSSAETVYVASTVQVIWAYRIRPDEQVGSMDEAIDAERAILQAVAQMSRAGTGGAKPGRVERAVAKVGSGQETKGEPFLVTVAEWTFSHHYAIERG